MMTNRMFGVVGSGAAGGAATAVRDELESHAEMVTNRAHAMKSLGSRDMSFTVSSFSN